MPDKKKFKLSKKQGLYAVAGVALVGSLAAAAITSPDMLYSIFDPDKYSFTDTGKNGNVAYNASEGVGNGSGDEDDSLKSNQSAQKPENNESDDKSLADSPEQNEATMKPDEEQNEKPENAQRDKDKEYKGSSDEPSKQAGVDKDGYSTVNTGISTDLASSEESDGEDLGADSENMVDLGKDDGNIESVVEQMTPMPRVTPRPTAVPAPTKKPSDTVAKPTQRPMFDSSSSGGSGNKSELPQVSTQPAVTAEPAPTKEPEVTPAPTKKPEVTKEPMPTEAPEPVKPSEIIKDNEEAGNEVQISKGEIGITNHTGGGGSVTSGGATKIDFTKFTGDQSEVEYIQVSSTIKTIDFETAKVLFPNLKGYVVSEKNKNYMSVDGVLYSKDGTTLYACPAKVTEITEFPEGLETIADGAFIGSSIETLVIPETVTEIGENAFAEASIDTIIFEGDSINLGATAFYNSADDGLSVKKLVFKSTTPPTVDDNSALKFKNPHTGLDTSGMVIEVPDSEDDSVLCAYMKAWGETIDGLYGSGMTSYLFDTPSGAGDGYSYENKALYKKIEATTDSDDSSGDVSGDGESDGTQDTDKKYSGYELLYVAPSTEGEFTPAYDTKLIAADAFAGCDKITAVNIPSTVESLEDGCFKGLDSLTSIVVAGTTPAQIGENVWQDIDPDEVKIYVYPDALDSYLASWGATLDKLFGEGSGEKIIQGAAESYVYIDGALYSVAEDGKTLVDAPHTDMDNFALAEGTVKIADGAFGSKYTYNYVLIPNTVKEIGANAFTSASIEVLVMTSAEPLELNKDLTAAGIKKIYVPSASLDAYKESWGEMFEAIEAPSMNYVADSHAIYGVDVDDNYTLYDLSTLYQGTFTMLDKVKEVREKALYDCDGVETINFSVITEKIGKESFAEMDSLKSVDMVRMTALTELPERAFYNSKSITDMQLPVLITKIGDSMAENCTSLITVNFNKLTKLEEIGDRAFYNNSSLEQVSLSSARSLVKVGESVFENCTSLTTVRMPLNLEKMGDRMFKNASSLGRVAFASNLKEIGDEALYGTALETMNIASLSDLETIGEGAFAECKSLREITLPPRVTKISDRMAENDTSLTKVVMSENTTEIGSAAFRGCSLLEEIIIPAAVEKIGSDAFAGCDSLKNITVESETPAEVGENAFGENLDGMKIYVPRNTYGIYVAAWDGVLYNRAAEIIVEATEEPEATAEPGTTEEPEATAEPETTAEPGTTEEPEATEEPVDEELSQEDDSGSGDSATDGSAAEGEASSENNSGNSDETGETVNNEETAASSADTAESDEEKAVVKKEEETVVIKEESEDSAQESTESE